MIGAGSKAHLALQITTHAHFILQFANATLHNVIGFLVALELSYTMPNG